VTYKARSLLGQTWALLLVAAISAGLADPAWAQGPDPAPTRVKVLRPEPAPTVRSKVPASQSTKTPSVTVRPRAVVFPPPPAPTAPQPPVSPPAPVQQARVETPKRPLTPQRPRTTSRKRAAKWASQRLGTAVDSSPDGMLLAGGVALFVLLLGETIFLALSVRFLRRAT
jgi:hypothetical protein